MSKLSTSSAAKLKSIEAAPNASVVDLDSYVPAFFTWIANKLSGGASSAYLRAFDVGIEMWRLLVLLAIEKGLTAQSISRTIGMDKASVSRALKAMQARGLIIISLDDSDGRLRVASITPKGRAVHDKILELALERERALLSVLDAQERETLIHLLHRLHDNLPAVEQATNDFLDLHYPKARSRRPRGASTE
ncbi:MarR family winged helix-turn-helix transcriptional regulator [Ottowia thiooxydans]|uniref:MarR family winged helix-turn-helix transcriptional regulator n=1 Tax=Ottowia thiooxydans TaxID=219182 RepID=UPI000419B09A|nr:MarR family transcriptional regulator [Ottowia thiooxydans]